MSIKGSDLILGPNRGDPSAFIAELIGPDQKDIDYVRLGDFPTDRLPFEVDRCMFGLRHHMKVVHHIVGSVAINVMDNLIRSQRPSDLLFSNQPMLGYIAAFRCKGVIGIMDVDIPIMDIPAADFSWSSMPRFGIARMAAKLSAGPFPAKRLATGFTNAVTGAYRLQPHTAFRDALTHAGAVLRDSDLVGFDLKNGTTNKTDHRWWGRLGAHFMDLLTGLVDAAPREPDRSPGHFLALNYTIGGAK